MNKPGNNDYLRYISLGTEIAVGLSLPMLAGYWLDQRFQTLPWFTLTGILVGIIVMIAIMIRLSGDFQNKDE